MAHAPAPALVLAVAFAVLLPGCTGGDGGGAPPASDVPPGGAAGGGTTAASAACGTSPSLALGPYFLEEVPERSDVRETRWGTPLTLRLNVQDRDGDSCTPRAGAEVDLWHADAWGVYSGVEGDADDWLRGSQVTDAGGNVSFETMYPGWYPGRAVHIHVRVRYLDLDFTSQLFFADAVSAEVFRHEPYSSHGPEPDTLNADDGIYSGGGAQMLVAVAPQDGGYAGTKTIVV